MTQAELAQRVGVEKRTIQRVEASDSNATLLTLHSIASTFAVTIEALMLAPEPEPRAARVLHAAEVTEVEAPAPLVGPSAEGVPPRGTPLSDAIEEALEPMRGVLPAEVIEEFRDIMREELRVHPAARRLLQRLEPPPVMQESGDAPTGAVRPIQLPFVGKKRERGDKR